MGKYEQIIKKIYNIYIIINQIYYRLFGFTVKISRRTLNIVVGSNTLSGNDSSKRTYSIKKTFPHKGFDFKNVHDDIGLVLLNDKIEFNDKVNLVKFAQEKDLDKANYEAVATGWGALKVKKQFEKYNRHGTQIYYQFSAKSRPDKLQQINLTVIDHGECKKVSIEGRKATDNQICTLTKFGEGMCNVSFKSNLPKIIEKK